MTRVAAYATAQNPWASAFLASAEAAGASILWRRGALWTPDQRCAADLVVSSGARGRHGDLIRDYAARGVPSVVLDLCRHRPLGEMYGVYLGGLQALPPAGVPGRREQYAHDAIQPIRTGGTKILVLGQRPHDASHGLGPEGLTAWLASETVRVAAETGLDVVYRPHPKGDPLELPVPHELQDRTQPLAFDDVAIVVTYCSTAGYEAILAGVPVTCHPSAFYSRWADLSQPREDLLDRVLATQWAEEEIAAGIAWDFVQWWLSVWQGRWNGAPPQLQHAPVYVGFPDSVGIYADETQEWAADIAAAIESSGPTVHWQAKYRASELDARKFDAVICYGARKGHAALLKGCDLRGVPALIGDLPRVRGLPGHGLYGGYYGFFANDLHALPPVGIPGRRMALAPDAIQPERARGDHILVLGQKPGDASHGLSVGDLSAWLSEQAARVSARTGLPIVYRPHPFCNRPTKLSCDHTVQSGKDPLSFDGVAHVVCYSSTGGFEAILAGIPVTCHERAFYSPWADLSGDREDLLERVLATQWNEEERRDGTAWRFLWRWMSGQLTREITEAQALASLQMAAT